MHLGKYTTIHVNKRLEEVRTTTNKYELANQIALATFISPFLFLWDNEIMFSFIRLYWCHTNRSVLLDGVYETVFSLRAATLLCFSLCTYM